MAIETNVPRGRRSFLTAIAGAVAGVAAASLTSAQRVLAAGNDGSPINVGSRLLDIRSETYLQNASNSETVFTAFNTGSGIGIEAMSGDGVGLRGASRTSSGVRANSSFGAGLHASSGNERTGATPPVAVFGEIQNPTSAAILGNNYATTGSAQGLQGQSNSPKGLAVIGWAAAKGIGLIGVSASKFPTDWITNVGVLGIAEKGRGGVFQGQAAPVRLVPSTAATHPVNGAPGDLFVDKSGRLWFCKGLDNWVKLA
ncbi:MAG: hypothetical protein U0869_07830 [Chloroflexota bacterium]